jgi:hypothetical protein
VSDATFERLPPLIGMLTRKQFLRSALGISVAALGLQVLSACGGDSSPTPDAAGNGSGSGSGSGSDSVADCEQNGTNSTIAGNHGHVLVVTAAEVTAGTDKTFNIQGAADHPHTVKITAAMFQMLQQNHAIMTVSSTDALHSHNIMVACV